MRRRSLIPTVLLAATLGTLVNALPAHAVAQFDVDDDCVGNNPSSFFYAGGPAEWWLGWYYGPAHGGCYMATQQSSGNSGGGINFASYYLPLSSSYDGNYSVYPYIVCTGHAVGNAQYKRYPWGTNYNSYNHYLVQWNYCNSGDFVATNKRFYQKASNPAYSGYVRMTDNAGSGQGGATISADKLFYIPS